MSHVDEGTLHAYLDGELSPAERIGLEQHLAQCAACRTQLAEERALLQRSTALLGSARPLERAAPPFEQLRRAPRRQHRGTNRRGGWSCLRRRRRAHGNRRRYRGENGERDWNSPTTKQGQSRGVYTYVDDALTTSRPSPSTISASTNASR